MPRFDVDTEITIAVPLAQVRETLVDFHRWPAWSPWLYLEPEADVRYEGVPGDAGHAYHWDGKKTGAGSMTLTGHTGDHVDCGLQFLKPFRSKADVRFELVPLDDAATRVTWRMASSMPFFMFWMIPTMRAMIGMDFDRGLRMLKDYLETGEVLSSCRFDGRVAVEPQLLVGLPRSAPLAAIGDVIGAAFLELRDRVDPAEVVGDPVAVYNRMDIKAGQCDFVAALPVTADYPPNEDGLLRGQVTPGVALRAVHTGAYRHLGNGWSVVTTEQRHGKYRVEKRLPPFEIYRNDPADTAERDRVTEIYLPLKGP